MNVSFYSKSPGLLFFQKKGTASSGMFSGMKDPAEEKGNTQSEKLRDMIRALYQDSAKKEKENSFSKLYGTAQSSEKKEEKKSSSRYRFKEVEMKIQRAKNALSAAQAFLSAKRKVLEIRRKISSGDGDPEDLQTELTHAKRMEMVARKKKHHLEMEELVENTQKLDERNEAQEEAAADLKNTVIEAAEEEVSEQEDAILDERGEMIEKAVTKQREEGMELSEEEMEELNEMIAEFGEEELEELEKAMEALEDLEAFDPHMSKEELEELKRKHRAAEQKAMVKADMDYLRDTIRHQTEKAGTVSGMNFGSGGSPVSMTASAGFAVPSVLAAVAGGCSMDVQV